jgi:hypothetical protein
MLLLILSCGPKKPPAAIAAPVDGFGLSKEVPVHVCLPDGEQLYLASLQCPDGSPPSFARAGNVGPRNAIPDDQMMAMIDPYYVLPEGQVDGHIIDLYEVLCADGSRVDVYMDMYHCTDPHPLMSVDVLTPRE